MIGDNLINRNYSCKVGKPESGRKIGSLPLKPRELEPLRKHIKTVGTEARSLKWAPSLSY